ncbi:hypothetical protein GQ457_01G022430 [Hibiscus cannabinus]
MWFLSPRSTFSPLEIVNGGSGHRKLASTVGKDPFSLFFSLDFGYGPLLPPSFWFTGMGIYTWGRGSLLGHVEDAWRVLRCVSWPMTRAKVARGLVLR